MQPTTPAPDDDAPEPLPSPRELRERMPVPEKTRDHVSRSRASLADLLRGRDADRVLAVVGPCSLHDPAAALEYAARLRDVATRFEDALLVVMRTYVEKPRTRLGWKGLVNDPDLDGSCDVASGMAQARDLLLRIGALGVACGAEILDPATPCYLADLLTWGSIGARTVESQTHRELASGLPMPVGFKNTTDGRLGPALDAMAAAAAPHRRLGLDAEGRVAVIRTRGNRLGHVVLRGGASPNHGADEVARAAAATAAQGVARGVLVDCSHGNSGRDPRRQAAACRSLLDALGAGEPGLLGLMLESHLEEGAQPGLCEPASTRPARYGVSITDPCMGFPETEALLGEVAEAVRGRRRRECPPGKRLAGMAFAGSEFLSKSG